ncbi:hypothetical protein MIR68_012662 [Amoeboaphelidium protococcarum]|nr:hypothetical protein MIR68_012662 [Amoeboaphelidium protococcarum]
MILTKFAFAALYATLIQANLQGAGSTLQAQVQFDWALSYNSLPFSYANTSIQYSAVGSGSGVRTAANGGAAWGSTDALPSVIAPEFANSFVTLPTFGSAIVITYNVPDIGCSSQSCSLIMDRMTVVKIFNGTITRWNDPALVANNPSLSSVNQDIKVIVRNDSSGTTTAFTQFLTKVSPEWSSKVGVNGLPNWGNAGLTPFARGAGSIGVVQNIIGNAYSVGYLDLADAATKQIDYARLYNRQNELTVANQTSAQIALAAAQGDFETLGNVDSTASGSYPITTFTFYALNKNVSRYYNVDQFRSVMRYIYWTYTDTYAQRVISRFSYVQLDNANLQNAISTLQSFVYSDSKPLYGTSVCDFDGLCQNDGVCPVKTSPFIPATIRCSCPKLYTNNLKNDCSELTPSLFITYQEPINGFLLFLAISGIIYNGVVAMMLVFRRNHPLIKAISPTFSLLILGGCTISYTGVFLFLGEPNDFMCNARPFWLSIAFGLVFGMMTAKNYRVYTIFGNLRRVNQSLSDVSLLLRFGSVICGLELLLSIIWVAASPLKPTVVLNASNFVVKTCVSGNATVASTMSALLYVFNAILLCACIYVAFQTRYAGEKFNESKSISFAIYTTILPLLVGLPLVYLPSLDYNSINILTCLLLILCPLFITTIMFGSKVYELYFARFFRKSLAYDMSNSIFARTATAENSGNKNFGDVSQSGLSFWQFSIRKKRLGAAWLQAVIFVIPELNWFAAVEDMTSSQLKVYESLKLTECQLADGDTPESCVIKHPTGEYSLESKNKDMMARFKKFFPRIQQTALELNKAVATKASSSISSSVVDDN